MSNWHPQYGWHSQYGFKTRKKWRRYGLKRKFKFTTSLDFEDPASMLTHKDWKWMLSGLENKIFRPSEDRLKEIIQIYHDWRLIP